MLHAEQNNILYPLQHESRKGHSCEIQLIEFVDDISRWRRGEISTASSLSILGERLSGPCALYGLWFFSSFVIPFVVLFIDFIVCCSNLHSQQILNSRKKSL
jgi:hypothetical protein